MQQTTKKKGSGSTAKEILLYLLIGGGITLGIANPAFLTPAIFIAHYLREEQKNKREKERIKSAFYYLRKKKLISIQKQRGKVALSLSKAGKDKADLYKIQSRLYRKKEAKKWDGNWHLVIFDIEDNVRIKRDALRTLLFRSGFKQLQKSVWIYPYDCKEEIGYVKEIFDINDTECRVIVSKNIGNDNDMRTAFSI